jgi:1-acyl-sn-glycerol-3-phosphate acyltransferase
LIELSSISVNRLDVQGGDATTAADPTAERDRSDRSVRPDRVDRSAALRLWYRFTRLVCATLAAVVCRWRASGHRNVPASGGTLLVCNHLSFLDVFFLAFPLGRPLNYVARSTLFVPLLGPLMRSVGGFPIQREGLGASGMKETLRRLRAGGIVVLFPEGTRSRDGQLGSLKPGIAALAARVGVPVVPAAVAGLFDVWPRTRLLPVPNPVRIHYGRPILPHELKGLDHDSITALIGARMRECHAEAARALQGDLTY